MFRSRPWVGGLDPGRLLLCGGLLGLAGLAACYPTPTTGQAGQACNPHDICLPGLVCVDGVCCTTPCDGPCERCDRNGDGTCTLIPEGQDPDEECGEVSCDGLYFGWDGNQCLGRQAVPAETLQCDGHGGCQSAAPLCPIQSAGPTTLTCDLLCQQPTAGSCTGSTPGRCDDLDLGEASCGRGECRRTVARCQAGQPVACAPGAPSVEACNGLDDDCDGAIDEAHCNGCPAGTVVPAGWACVPAGTYTVGSPAGEVGRDDDETPHDVQLTRPYLMLATEVTQAEWLATMGSNPSRFQAGGKGGCDGDLPCDDRPVEQVTWYEAVAYSNARSLVDGLERCYQDPGGADYDAVDAAAKVTPSWPRGPACLGYRLPTEAEWEVAARAGTQTATSAGDLDDGHKGCEQPNPSLDGIAWFCGNSSHRTHPVATKAANGWGLFDLLGNVWEWCWDWSADYPAGSLVDPVGPAESIYRVLRGGSWGRGAKYSRSAARSAGSPDYHGIDAGFRLVRSIP